MSDFAFEINPDTRTDKIKQGHSLAGKAISKLDKGEGQQFSVNEAKALASLLVEKMNLVYSTGDEEIEDVEAVAAKDSFWEEVNTSAIDVDLGAQKFLVDQSIENIVQRLFTYRSQLSSQERVEFSAWMASHLDEFQFLSEYLDNSIDPTSWFFKDIDLTNENVQELLDQVWKYISSSLFFKHTGEYNQFFLDELRLEIELNLNLRKAFEHRLNKPGYSKLLECFLNRSFFSAVYFIENLNQARRILQGKKENDAEASFLADVIRQKLGLEKEFRLYTTIAELYKDVDFDKYPTNQETIDERIRWLTELLQGRENSLIVDLGCGTGDTVLGLLKNGFSYTYGIDVSEKNVAEARQKLLDQDADEHTERFIVGDWTNLPYADKSIDVMTCLGRSLTHAEDPATFNQILREVYRVLKPGGTFIFDMPNPKKGIYAKNRESYDALIKERFSSKTNREYMQFVVDSPDGKVFYNRYIPDEETIETHLALNNFTLLHELTSRSPIPKWEGSENMQFVCQKNG